MDVTSDGWHVYHPNKRPKMVSIITGESGTLHAFKLEFNGRRSFAYTSDFLKSFKPLKLHNVPEQLFRFVGWQKDLAICPNGILLLGTSFFGRDFLKSLINHEEQKIVLHLHRELSLCNMGLINLLKRIPVESNDCRESFFNELGNLFNVLKDINVKLHGDGYKDSLKGGDYDIMFKSYLDLGTLKNKDDLALRDWNKIIANNAKNCGGGDV